jgi:hypothetical protein
MQPNTLSKVVVLSATFLAISAASADAQNVIVNGGFETGNLSGWTTSGLGSAASTCPSGPRDWNVSSVGTATGCTPVSNPVEGRFAAYNMYDGPGPLEYTLSQSFLVPTGLTSAQLGFLYTFINPSDATRTFGFRVLDGASSIFTQALAHSGSLPWTSYTTDLTAFLAGQGGRTLTLQYFSNVPRTWTGPAGLGLDAVSLNVQAVTTTPEPASIVLVATGMLAVFGVARRRRTATTE